jgi:tRNA pseudouridine32 synthase / 23S rRNA pseudouridine746 synthase
MSSNSGGVVVPALEVWWSDDRVAVIDKPSGLLSCPGRDPSLHDSVQTRVPEVFPHATGSVLVHRLDQPTSGLMVVALDAAAHLSLRKQFDARTITKQYVAVLEGVVATDAGDIDLPHRLDVDHRPHQIYDAVHGKMSRTRFTVLSRQVDPARTRVLFEPLTGRTHQLRVHASHPLGLGCPIAGDALYGDANSAPRLLLHASALAFDHPSDGRRCSFTSSTPF